jgi:hypothetical protein
MKFLVQDVIPCAVGVTCSFRELRNFGDKYGLNLIYEDNVNSLLVTYDLDMTHQEKFTVCVFINKEKFKKLKQNEAHAFLSHEALHCCRFVFSNMGDENPSWETEAYMLTAICKFLFDEWDRLKV